MTGSWTDSFGSGTARGAGLGSGVGVAVGIGIDGDFVLGSGTTVFGLDATGGTDLGSASSDGAAEPLAREGRGSMCPVTSSAASNSLLMLTSTSSDCSTEFKWP